MEFKIVHNNYNVFNLDKSINFYEEAFGFCEQKRITAADGSFIIVYMGNKHAPHKVELTWLKGMERPYNLGDNEIHLALETNDYETAYKHHKDMDCICYENSDMGIYFVSDPDGYWIEIIPQKD